jgi:ferric-dicitrate binding protein FerR (iron transport regulator)
MENKDPDSKLNKFLQEEKRFIEDLKGIDLDRNWERFQQSVHAGSDRASVFRFSQNTRILLRIAAAVVLLLAVSATLYITTVLPSHHLIHASAESSHMEITLSEGTQISLNQGAVLSYPKKLKPRIREVTLSGEAFFNVSKVKNSRFYVKVGTITVQVTGTQFNIREVPPGDIEVSVVEGEVLIYETGKRDRAVRIAAGERSVYTAEQGGFENEHLDSENFLFWKTGTLAYRDTPLEVVFEEIGNYFHREIIIKDPELLKERWNSTHQGQQLDEIIGELCIYFNLECIERNDSILVQRRQP